jgi:hypothetical protein
MPAVMMAPVDTVVMARGAMVTDDARTMHGQHPAAASSSDKGGSGIDGGIIVSVGIVIRIIVVIDAADKSPAEVTPMTEAATGKSRRSGNDRGCRADHAAANDGATHATSAATAAPTTASSTTAASAAMAATNFNQQFVGSSLFADKSSADFRHARIDRRHRLSALAGEDCHHHKRRRDARHG